MLQYVKIIVQILSLSLPQFVFILSPYEMCNIQKHENINKYLNNNELKTAAHGGYIANL